MSASPLLFLAWVTAASLVGSSAVSAQNASEPLLILREEGLEVQGGQLKQMYAGAKKTVEDTLGWKLGAPPRLVLTADKEHFEKMSGSPLVSAFAVPRQHTVVMLVSRAASDSYVLRETLEHELCHLVLHAHIDPELLPKWLDEGICQWLSGSLGEILAGQGLVTSGINLAHHPIPLQQLTKTFPADRRALLKAYEESRLFVDFLRSRYGRNGLLRLLDHLKGGQEIEAAVLEVFSNSLQNLESEWLDELRSRNLWLLWISQYLYEILFFLGALLTVLAFLRVTIRKRAYDPDEDDDA